MTSPLAIAALRSPLVDAIGERFDIELWAGFLIAVGAAFLRGANELVVDPIAPGSSLVVEFQQRVSLLVPVQKGVAISSLDDALLSGLDAAATELRRMSAVDAGLPVAALLDLVAEASRGRVTETGRQLKLLRIRTVAPDHRARPNAILATALSDPDWRVRMTAVLLVGRGEVSDLADRVLAVEIPPAGGEISDQDRRALLALRDAAAARATGRRLERPVHPDPKVAAHRAAFLAAIEAALAGLAMPAPGDPAGILARLAP